MGTVRSNEDCSHRWNLVVCLWRYCQILTSKAKMIFYASGISTPMAVRFSRSADLGLQAKSNTRPTDRTPCQTPPGLADRAGDHSLHDRHDGPQRRTQGRLYGRADADLKNAAKTARYKARRPPSTIGRPSGYEPVRASRLIYRREYATELAFPRLAEAA